MPVESTANAKIFISYSRRDLQAAEELLASLANAGFDAYLDKHDIAPGEPWRERLAALIDAADSIVFLVSPDSVRSEICDWEVNRAERQGKRVFPVVVRATDDDLIPQRLRRLNFVFAVAPYDTEEQMRRLVDALRTDLAWVREHTHIGELAQRWDTAGRPARLLLQRRDQLTAAETWRAAQPAAAPPPTSVQLAFLLQSRRMLERRQRRFAVAALLVAVLTSVLSAVALLQKQEADVQRDLAKYNETLANRNAVRAEREAHIARLQREAALARAQSRDAPVAALERALAAVTEHQSSQLPSIPSLYASLFDTLQRAREQPRWHGFRAGLYGTVTRLAMQPDTDAASQRVIVTTRDFALLTNQHGQPLAAPVVGDDGRHLFGNDALWWQDGSGFALATGARYLDGVHNVGVSIFNADGTLEHRVATTHPRPIVVLSQLEPPLLLAADDAGGLLRIDAQTGAVELLPTNSGQSIRGLYWDGDDRLVIGAGPVRNAATWAPALAMSHASGDLPTTSLATALGLAFVQWVGHDARAGVHCMRALPSRADGFVTCDGTGGASMWRWDYKAQRYAVEQRYAPGAGQVLDVAVGVRADILATGTVAGSITVFSRSGVALGPTLQRRGGPVLALGFMAGDETLLSAGSGAIAIDRWALDDIAGRTIDEPVHVEGPSPAGRKWPETLVPVAFAALPDGLAAIATEAGEPHMRPLRRMLKNRNAPLDELWLWHGEAPLPQHRVEHAKGTYFTAIAARDTTANATLVTGDTRGQLILWNRDGEKTTESEPLRSPTQASLAVTHLAVLADSRVAVALADPDQARLRGPKGELLGLTTNQPSFIGVWEPGAALSKLRELEYPVSALAAGTSADTVLVSTVRPDTRDARNLPLRAVRLELLATQDLAPLAVIDTGLSHEDFVRLRVDARGGAIVDTKQHSWRWPLGRSELATIAARRVRDWPASRRFEERERSASEAVKQGESAAALHALREAQAHAPAGAGVLVRLGNLERATGEASTRRERALRAYDAAIKADPTDTLAYWQRARAHFTAGQWQAAERDLEAMLALPNMYLRATLVTADIPMNRQIAEQSWAVQARARQEPQAYLAYVRTYLGKWQSAATLLTQLIEQHGLATPQHFEYRARARLRMRKVALAVDDLDRAVALLANEQTPYGTFGPYAKRYASSEDRVLKRAELDVLLAEGSRQLGHAYRNKADAAYTTLQAQLHENPDARSRIARTLARAAALRLAPQRFTRDFVVGRWFGLDGKPRFDVRATNAGYVLINTNPDSTTSNVGDMVGKLRWSSAARWQYVGQHLWGGARHDSAEWGQDGGLVAQPIDDKTLWFAYEDSRYRGGWLVRRATGAARP